MEEWAERGAQSVYSLLVRNVQFWRHVAEMQPDKSAQRGAATVMLPVKG